MNNANTPADAQLRSIIDIYNARADIPFDGSTYSADVSADLALLREFARGWPDSVCDVGCGLGWHLDALADAAGGNLWGIDVSERSLERFVSRSENLKSGKVRVVIGDVREWHCCGFFRAVTSFLACLGEFSGEGDERYLRALVRLLRPGGILVMTTFCQEAAESLVGNWRTTYSKEDPDPVDTAITFERSTQSLRIAQAWGHNCKKVPTETMRLYRRDELCQLLQKVGFVNVRVLLPHSDDCGIAVRGKDGLAIVLAQVRE